MADLRAGAGAAEVRAALAAQSQGGARLTHPQLLRALMDLWGYEAVCAFFWRRVCDAARSAARGPAPAYSRAQAELIALRFSATWHGCPLEGSTPGACAPSARGAFDGELLGFDDAEVGGAGLGGAGLGDAQVGGAELGGPEFGWPEGGDARTFRADLGWADSADGGEGGACRDG